MKVYLLLRVFVMERLVDPIEFLEITKSLLIMLRMP